MWKVTAATIFVCMYTPVATSAEVLGKYQCDVEDISGFDLDSEFRRNNLSKEFFISAKTDEIVVVAKSEEFISSINHYSMIQTSGTNYIGVEASSLFIKTIVVGRNPDDEGEHNATISIQGSFFSNNWKLNCRGIG